jgi:ferredoxin
MIEADKSKCLRCGGCIVTCPKAALTLTEHGITCSPDCVDCRTCVNFCPVGALKVKDEDKE